MPPPRLATSILLRATRLNVPRATRQFRASPASAIRTTTKPLITKASQFRAYSSDSPQPSKIYEFKDIKGYISNPSTSRKTLIDVRESAELQESGTIPGSINIPVKSSPDSFFITEEEFEDRFGFGRPGKSEEVVFYCRSGVRSKAAAELAKQAGWANVGEYPGSWLDWEKNNGDKEVVK